MHLRTFLSCYKKKPLNWVELIRQQIKARYGFGCSIQGIEKQNKVLIKILYRFSSGERAVKASRVTKALPAEASQILELDWLIPEGKNDNRVTISSAGRNSMPVDMVIEQVDRAVWVSIGSKSKITKNL